MAGAAFNLGDILATVKFNTDSLKAGSKDFQNVGEQTQSFGDKVQKGLNIAAVGLGIVGAGLTLYAKSASDYTVQLVKDSKALGAQIGVSTEEASRLVAAVGRMGISAQDASTLFGIFSKKIVESTTSSKDNALANQKLQIEIDKTKASIAETTAEINKNGDKSGALGLKLRDLNNTLATQQNQLNKSADSFAKLGVSTVDAQGKQRDFESILGDVADKFKAMPNGIDKSQIAMDLFGRSGKSMIPILNQGSQGIQDLEKEADKLGLTLNANTIAKINELVKSEKDLKQQQDALKIAVGTETAPILTKFNQTLNNILGSLLQTKGPVHDVTVGFLAFGGPVASGAAAVAGFGANVVTIIPEVQKAMKAMKEWTAVQWLLNIAMDANPVVLLVLAILALIAAIAYVVTHMEEVGAAVNKVSDKFGQLNGWVQAAIAVFMPFLGIPLLIISHWDQISGFFQGIVDYITFAWRQWQTNITNISLALAGFVMGIWNGLVGFFVGAGNAIAGVIWSIGSWFGQIPGWVAGAVGGAISWFGSLPGRILGAIGNLGGLLFGVGKSVIQGFLDGMGSLIGTIGSFFLNKLPGWIQGPFKKALGIHSPSRVFLAHGVNIIKGLVNGLNDARGMVTDAMDNLSASLIAPSATFAPQVASAAGGFNVAPASGMGTQITVDLRDSSIVGQVPANVAEQIGDAIITKLQRSVRL